MAKAVIGAEIKVDSRQAEQSVGNIRTRIKEARNELINAIENFGEFSAEAVNAAKKVEQLKGTMDDASRLVSNFDGDRKFQAFGAAVSTVAGGFAAAQGAMALFGTKSKEVEQALLEVQAAMALTQGINSVLEGVKVFRDLGNVIKASTVFQKGYAIATAAAAATQRLFTGAVATTATGFKALRTAIITTGIGALVVGIGLLIEKIIEWTSSTDDQIDSQEALKNATEDLNNALSSQYSRIDRLNRIEKLRAQIAGASQEQIEDIDAKATTQKIAHIDGLIKLAKDYNISTATLEKERFDLTQKREEEALEQQVKRSERSRAAAAKAEEARLAAIAKAREAQAKAYEKYEADKKAFDESLNTRPDIEADMAATFEQFQKEEEQLTEMHREAEEARAVISAEYMDDLDAKRQADLEREKEAAQQRIDIINSVSNATMIAAEIIGKQTAVGKALAIATALINTYQGATEVLRAKSVLPEPFGTISKIANVAMIIATGIKSIKAITAVKVPGSSGGGASAPSISAPLQPQLATTTLNQNQINQIGNAANRSYILEADVSGSQERIRRLNRAARIN